MIIDNRIDSDHEHNTSASNHLIMISLIFSVLMPASTTVLKLRTIGGEGEWQRKQQQLGDMHATPQLMVLSRAAAVATPNV
jgi:hypothetical protein